MKSLNRLDARSQPWAPKSHSNSSCPPGSSMTSVTSWRRPPRQVGRPCPSCRKPRRRCAPIRIHSQLEKPPPRTPVDHASSNRITHPGLCPPPGRARRASSTTPADQGGPSLRPFASPAPDPMMPIHGQPNRFAYLSDIQRLRRTSLPIGRRC